MSTDATERRRLHRPPAASILHVDMDCFFVSLELVRNPQLRGQPVVVGGAGRRGVVASASYEARAYGINSAMPGAQALRLCAHTVFLPGDHRYYGTVSKRIMQLLRTFTPLVEPLSVDEAFLDVSGAHAAPTEVGQQIRRAVQEAEGIDCSVGVASSKFLAKLASKLAKPTPSLSGPKPGPGVLEVPLGQEEEFLHARPVSDIWGAGPVTLAKLERLGINTVGELAAVPLSALQSAVGKAQGQHLHDLAHCVDPRPVVAESSDPKSVSHEKTFPHDLHTHLELGSHIVLLADAVASRLRGHGLAGRELTLKVRFGDFVNVTRSHTFADPVDSGTALAREAKRLLQDVDVQTGVRLIGVGMSKLTRNPTRQLTLDEEDSTAWHDVDRAVDEVRHRFGRSAIAMGAPTSEQSD